MKKTNIMICAGEVSSDLLAADLVLALKVLSPDLEFFGMGGSRMQEAGVELLWHIQDLEILGVPQILKNIGRFIEIERRLIKSAKVRNTRMIILVDSPGFNIPFGFRAKKKLGCRIIYYVAPQVWVWWPQRIQLIRKFVDAIFVIFPFEEAIYRNCGVETYYLGCPVFEIIKHKLAITDSSSMNDDKKNIALLPGSRKYEIIPTLPLMLKTAELISLERRDVTFTICCAASWLRRFILDIISSSNIDIKISIVENKTYEVMQKSRLVLTAPGIATLEAAILSIPLIVIFKLSLSNWYALNLFQHADRVSLVNLIMEKEVVPEFIQWQAKPRQIADSALSMLENQEEAKRIISEFDSLKKYLYKENVSYNVAKVIFKNMAQNRAIISVN